MKQQKKANNLFFIKQTKAISWACIFLTAQVSAWQSQASTAHNGLDSSKPIKKNSTGASTETNNSNNRNKTNKTGNKQNLVPPPPPISPMPGALFSGNAGNSSLLGDSAFPGEIDLYMNVHFMSADDLKFNLETLDTKLDGAKQDLEFLESECKEKKNRSNSFELLFKEGVVSRKELETANRESKRSQNELELAERKVEGLKRSRALIEERLSLLEKSGSQKSNQNKKPD